MHLRDAAFAEITIAKIATRAIATRGRGARSVDIV